MSRLQNFTLATAISILGCSSITISNAEASVFSSKLKLISLNPANQVTNVVNHAQLAQNPNTTATESNSSESDDEMIDALQKRQEKIDELKELPIVKEKLEDKNSNEQLDSSESLELSPSPKNSKSLSQKMLTFGLPATILFIAVATPFLKGIVGVFLSNFQQKFGKPKIPDRSLNLHNNALKEIKIIGKQVEKTNNEKFTSEEFILLLQIKINIAKGTEDYPELNYQVELLKAAIVAQKSFLKLEATELRYRSRKQQEFYQYVAENLEAEIDKEEFATRIKQKQTEILPLINTEEGKKAINSYAQEINELSKHELGLKLLALFKKYDLKDFSIIKQMADAIEGLQGHDLMSSKRLVAYVREYYDLFDKIAPILGISKNDNSHATYARILQFIGLNNRHGSSYIEFKELVRLLQKWEKPYGTIILVREQFSPQEYQIPSEFQQEIPGTSIYQKYAQYLADLL
jgi:hypothetical protein